MSTDTGEGHLGYAAPVLLELTAVSVVGAVAWNETAEDRARATLQAAGLHLLERGRDGTLTIRAITPTLASLPQVKRTPRHFSRRIVEADLYQPELLQCQGEENCFPELLKFSVPDSPYYGSGPINLAPLASLTTLLILDLSNTRATDLPPLIWTLANQAARHSA